MPLVVVPTPLGNLGDVTLRALDVLGTASLVIAEDTRVARKLFAALGIPRPTLWSYREHNADRSTAAILERASRELVALTCDAGLPGISDPGSELVAAARSAGIAVEVLPGPSAAFGVAALSGFPLRRFVFEGFVPRAHGERRAAFARALALGTTTIWFDSPRRILATLADLAVTAPGARVFLVREYTKLYEQQAIGTAAEVAAQLAQPVRGEVAFAIGPYAAAPERPLDRDAIDDAIDALLAKRYRVGDVARELARQGLGQRSALYQRASARRTAGKGGLQRAERREP